MVYPHNGHTGSFGGDLELMPPRNAAVAPERWVHARASLRDSGRIDPRCDPAYHNQVLFAGSER